eukprot:2563466-Alexandrium_andersonii.AAC.1
MRRHVRNQHAPMRRMSPIGSVGRQGFACLTWRGGGLAEVQAALQGSPSACDVALQGHATSCN